MEAILILLWISLAFVVARIAKGRGRSQAGYFILSLFATPLLAAIFLAAQGSNTAELQARELRRGRSVKCPFCAGTIPSGVSKCMHCASDVRFCRSCGACLPQTTDVCTACGKSATGPSTSQGTRYKISDAVLGWSVIAGLLLLWVGGSALHERACNSQHVEDRQAGTPGESPQEVGAKSTLGPAVPAPPPISEGDLADAKRHVKSWYEPAKQTRWYEPRSLTWSNPEIEGGYRIYPYIGKEDSGHEWLRLFAAMRCDECLYPSTLTLVPDRAPKVIQVDTLSDVNTRLVGILGAPSEEVDVDVSVDGELVNAVAKSREAYLILEGRSSRVDYKLTQNDIFNFKRIALLHRAISEGMLKDLPAVSK